MAVLAVPLDRGAAQFDGDGGRCTVRLCKALGQPGFQHPWAYIAVGGEIAAKEENDTSAVERAGLEQ